MQPLLRLVVVSNELGPNTENLGKPAKADRTVHVTLPRVLGPCQHGMIFLSKSWPGFVETGVQERIAHCNPVSLKKKKENSWEDPVPHDFRQDMAWQRCSPGQHQLQKSSQVSESVRYERPSARRSSSSDNVHVCRPDQPYLAYPYQQAHMHGYM